MRPRIALLGFALGIVWTCHALEKRTGDAQRDAPPRDACERDEDCTIAMVGPGDEPCCDITVTAAPVARAWLLHFAEYRKSRCENVECPPLPLPGPPPLPCAQSARCTAGTCTNACPPAGASR